MSRFMQYLAVFLFCVASANAGAQVDFGSVAVGKTTTQLVTVTISGTHTFNTISAVSLGSNNNLDFVNANTGTCKTGITYTNGETCTFGVTFKPTLPGQRIGAVVLTNTNTHASNFAYLKGTGLASQYQFSAPAAQAATPLVNSMTLQNPAGLAVGEIGTAYIVDPQAAPGAVLSSVWLYQATQPAKLIPANGSAGDNVASVNAVAVDGAGNLIIAGSDSKGASLAVSIPVGATVGQEYSEGPGFSFIAVSTDAAGNIYLLDNSNNLIEYFTANGTKYPSVTNLEGDGIDVNVPSSLAVDPAGNVYIGSLNSIVKVPADGGPVTNIYPTVDGLNVYPAALAVNGIGDLYIADESNARVVTIPASGADAYAYYPVVDGIAVHPVGIGFDAEGFEYLIDTPYTPGGSSSARVIYVEQGSASLNFATTAVGATSSDSPKTLTIENFGNQPLQVGKPTFPTDFTQDLSVPNQCGSAPTLQGGQTCKLAINFKPLSISPFSEDLPLSGQPTPTIKLNGIGTEELFSATRLDFGSQQIGTSSASQQITVSNVGTQPITFYQLNVLGANAKSFIFGSTCGASLPAGKSCTVHGHFTPTATGPLTASLQIVASDGGNGLTQIPLTGTGTTPPAATLSATTLNFGTVQVGTSGTVSQVVTLTNTGGSPLAIHGVTVTGPNASSFVLDGNCTSTLAAGGSCAISGHLAPKTTGPLSATITFSDNASGSPQQQVTLTGTGTNTPATTYTLTPTSINLGNGVIGRAANAEGGAIFTNTGTGNLIIENIQMAGPDHASFSSSNNCYGPVPPGGTCGLSVHFTATRLGVQNASIVVTVNIAGPPPTIALTGTGVVNAIASFSATQFNFGTVAVGQSSPSQSVTLTNTGGVTLHFGGPPMYVGGANPSSFAFGLDCPDALPVGASCTLHGHFAPTATGPLTATIYIMDDAGPRADNATQTITVTGTGK